LQAAPQRSGWRSWLMRYGAALGAVAVACAVRVALIPVWGPTSFPFIFFFPAVVFAAWYGRLGPAVMAILLSALAADWFFIEPRNSLLIGDLSQWSALGIFCLVSICLTGAIEAMHRANAQAMAAREELSNQKEMLVTTLASIGDAVIVAGLDQRIVFLNGEAERLTGWKAAEAIGQPLGPIFRIIDETTREPIEDPAEKVLRLGTVSALADPTLLISRTGVETPIDHSAAPIRDSASRLFGMVVVFRDFSERKKAEATLREREERFRAMADGAPVMIWVNGPDKRCTWFNRRWLEFTGRTMEQELGTGWTESVHPDDLPGCLQTCDNAFAQRQPFSMEYRLRRQDGAWRWILDHGVPLNNAKNEFMGYIGSCIDVTDQKQIAEVLRESEARERARAAELQAIMEAVPAVIWIARDPDCRVIAGNRVSFEFLRLPKQTNPSLSAPEGERPTNFEVRCDGRVLKPEELPVQRAARGEEVRNFEEEVRFADGVSRFLLGNATPLRDATGALYGSVAAFVDITERKRAEEALRESEQRLQHALEAGQMGAWEWDIASGKVVWSPGLEQIHGLAPGTFGGGFDDFKRDIHPEDLDAVVSQIQEVLRSGRDYHVIYRMNRPDGALRWLEAFGRFVRGADGKQKLTGVCMDITERKQIEEALRDSERRLAYALEASSEGLWEWNIKTGQVSYSPRWMESLGYTPEEVPAHVSFWESIVHPEDMPGLRQALEDHFAGRTPVYAYENRLRKKSGEYRWNLDRGKVVEWDADGRPVRMIGTDSDITERKRAEQALRESEQQFRQIADAMPQMVWTARPDGFIDYYNERWYEFTGFPRGQFGQSSWEPILHPEDRQRCIDTYFGCIRDARPFAIEYRFKDRSQGGYRWFMGRALPVRNERGELVKWFGTCTDIDDQKRAEETLEKTVEERTARLREMIGELQQVSYAITHDMRAPLRAMAAFAQLLLEQFSDPKASPEAQDYCRRILTAARRLDKLIQDALSYSKAVLQELPMEPVDLSKLVRGIIETYPNFHAEHADIDLCNDLPVVLGNESLLTQCFSNLLGNAVKFVAPGVKPRVKVCAESCADGFIRIWVSDNGIGIPPHARPRLFGMFQKLDNEYEGTGIGLAIVRKVVERMGGRVGVESETGQGSRFWVELRRASI
ncbi:MAG: PAS domain S-box protein, partial [Verrucomicrobiota bacterium]